MGQVQNSERINSFTTHRENNGYYILVSIDTSTQTLTSVASLMDNLLWLYDTPNAAVNYLNSCQTYDRYRMQVTDHRSQVQVRVKVTMLNK